MYVITAIVVVFFFFFKQKTAYEMRISDWSSDLCSSDLGSGDRRWFLYFGPRKRAQRSIQPHSHMAITRNRPVAAMWSCSGGGWAANAHRPKIGRASCRERVCKYV